MNTQDITVDLSKKNVKPESIVLRQGDKSGTTLRVKVLDNGVNVSSLDGYVAKFIMKLPYNRFYYEVEGTISGSMLTFVIDESYAAVQSGVTNIAYVALVNGDVTRMSANNIRVEILPSALDGFTPPPEWTDPIDEFIEEQTARVDTIVENAESATTAANTAATNANDKAALANTAATNANTKAGLANEAAINANAKAQEADEAAQAADEAREAIQDDLAAKANKDGHYSLFGAGTSDALMSTDGEVDTFARRVSEHDGACKIVSLRGNTVRWNQIVEQASTPYTHNGVTFTPNGDGSMTVNGTATANAYRVIQFQGIAGHKYFYRGCPSGGSDGSYKSYITSGGFPSYHNDYGDGAINSTDTGGTANFVTAYITNGYTANNLTFWPQIFDLTAMFGAGNEPSTVEEFVRRFPESYYPYDAGSLLSVNIEGMKSVGFNKCGFTPQYMATRPSVLDKTKAIKLKANTPYYWRFESITNATTWRLGISVFDDDGTFIQTPSLTGLEQLEFRANTTSYLTGVNTSAKWCKFTPLSDVWIMPFFMLGDTSANSVMVNPCINISDPARNGTYKPYVEHAREIPPNTTFPDGILRSAGTAYDERTPTRDVKRIGSVNLETLSWASTTNERWITTAPISYIKWPSGNNVKANIICDTLEAKAANDMVPVDSGNGISILYQGNIVVRNGSTTDKPAGALYYELATLTETVIDPPLNFAYPTEQGGTESIVIPTGEQSAAPTMAMAYAYNADGVRDISQAIIATIEGSTASTNYAIGGYFVHAGKLYKATSAIATGETINPGTNCVQTTVMAELLALTA